MSLLLAALAATLFLAEDGTPTIRYAPEHGGRFVDASEFTHSVARTRFWSYDTKCLSIGARRFERIARDCGPADFRLSWDEQSRDRIYPGVVRLRNGGALLFTQYLQPLTDDGNLAPWEARAPKDGVVAFRGEKSTASIALGERYFSEDGRGYVYLGPDRFREERAGRVLVDDGVPAAIEAEMLGVAPRLLEAFGRRLGAQPAERPSLYLTWVNRETAGFRDVQADVVPGSVIRFGLSGQGWGSGGDAALASFRKLLAHELVHLWNAEAFRPMAWSAPWVAEGNAELLAAAGLLSIGLVDAPTAAELVEAAYNECALIAASRAWVAIPSRERGSGRIPYVCGMAMQFAAVAAARRTDPAMDVFAFWRGLWSRTPRYYEAAIQQHFAAIGDAKSAAAMQAMLTDAATALAPAMTQLLHEAGVVAGSLRTLTPSLRTTLGRQVFAALMQADCKGGMSFYTQSEQFLVGDVGGLECGSLRAGLKLRYLEGVDLIEAAEPAVAKARAACDERKSVRLASSDGATIVVPCPAAPLPDPRDFLRLDPAEVARVLSRP